MRAYRLTGTISPVDRRPELANLVDCIGGPKFAPALFQSTFNWTRTQHLTAFVFDPGRPPQMVFAENAGTGSVARKAAEHYCGQYWRQDLVNMVSRDPTVDGATGISVVQTRASDIADADYRRLCYTGIGLEDRISLSETRGDRTLRLNFYRNRACPFEEHDILCISGTAQLLLALVRQHAQRALSHRTASREDFRERIAVVAPSLTPRETEVCAAMMIGMSAEGIALDLGVGINTVLTYRKRAYARLGISSQNQLMRLVLN